MRLIHHLAAGHIFSIASRVPSVDRLAVHLSQQNVRDRPYHGVRRAFQQIGKPHQKSALAQANGVVNICEGKKLDPQLRGHSSGPQLPVFLIKDFEQSLTHSEARLARRRSVWFDTPSAPTVHSDLPAAVVDANFFLCFAASSWSASSLR